MSRRSGEMRSGSQTMTRRSRLGVVAVVAGLWVGGCAADPSFDIVKALPPGTPLRVIGELQNASLHAVVLRGDELAEYELGRRFEYGIGGLPKDLVCAKVKYRSSTSPFARRQLSRLERANPGLNTADQGQRCWAIEAGALNAEAGL
jgi:hypothetical protein